MTRSVIVNVDDFGLSAPVNAAALELLDHGAVTSTTVMANLVAPEALSLLAEHWRARGRSYTVGVHVNLTLGHALSGASPLTDAGGVFTSYREQMRRLLCGLVPLGALRRELDAQIDRLVQQGLPPSHLDSHQHVFRAPVAFGVATGRARARGIPALRSQRRLGLTGQRDGVARVAKNAVGTAYGWIAWLRGIATPGALVEADAELWQAILDQHGGPLACLPRGVTELFAHASTDGTELAALSSRTVERGREYRLLGELARRAVWAECGVELVDYQAVLQQ